MHRRHHDGLPAGEFQNVRQGPPADTQLRRLLLKKIADSGVDGEVLSNDAGLCAERFQVWASRQGDSQLAAATAEVTEDCRQSGEFA
jgi:hypothetical protein